MDKKNTIIFGISSYKDLAKKISKQVKITLGEISKTVFADGEILIFPENTVRGKDVFVVQSTSTPAHDNFFELFIFIDALKRASAKTVNIIMPYYGYARQDRKCKSHQPITSKLVAKLLQATEIDRLITFDLHSPQIEGFFEKPVDNLSGLPIICKYINDKKIANLTIVSPDRGGVVRARELADLMNKPLAMIDKKRTGANEVEVVSVLGDINGRNCLLIDDMIDTAGTIVKASEILKNNGAKKIYIASTHPVFSGPAVERLSSPLIDEVIVTDTIKIPDNKKFKNLKVISICDFLSDVVNSIIEGKPVGRIFNKYTDKII